MKAMIFAVALIALPLSAEAQTTPLSDLPAGVYVSDPTHTSVTWKVNHLGLSHYTARFTESHATVNLDPSNPEKSTLVASVKPFSLKTDFPKPEEKDFDKELITGADWFNAGTHPEISFTSTGITLTGDNTGIITGDLNLLGVKKPMTLNVTFNGAYAEHPFTKAPAIGFSATGTIKRSEWGMTNYVPNIGDDVTILIETELGHTPKQ